MMDYSFRQAGHVRRFVIKRAGPIGWEVSEEEDSRVVRRVQYTDWHRVERARTLMDLTMSELARSGWVEV
jgi:hypothetical protein